MAGKTKLNIVTDGLVSYFDAGHSRSLFYDVNNDGIYLLRDLIQKKQNFYITNFSYKKNNLEHYGQK